MKLEKIYPKGFAANTYVLTADGKNAVVIDPSQPAVAAKLNALGLTPAFVLLTHAHFDHVGGVPALQEMGAKVFCSKDEYPLIGTDADLTERFSAKPVSYRVDGVLADGQQFKLCGIDFIAIATPGHTAGSMCFLARADGMTLLFTGDTLFAGNAGRTDFPTGSLRQLRESMRKLSSLTGDYPVYPGHEEGTTLEEERRNNPYMTGA